MKLADYVLIAIIILLAATAVVSIVRQRKKGGCCGQCRGCALSGKCSKQDKTEK